MQTSPHIPVMLAEAVAALALTDAGIYVDATAGAGGHSAAILQGIGDQGRLVALDRDGAAVQLVRDRFATDRRVTVCQRPFSELAAVIGELGLTGQVDGILVDLGVSSMQLDQPGRGFSFMREGELDMRMDTSAGTTLADWLASIDEAGLIRVLREYGEERYAKRIARAIIDRHQSEPITSTTELAQIVAAAHPRHQRDKHPATRTFQALRIAVNDELGELQKLLAGVINLLAPGGRLVVLSFHSLEDRIVKNFIQQHSRTRADLPLDLPVIDAPTPAPLMRVRVDKKPGRAEVRANPRSRSVIMRVAQRTSTPYPQVKIATERQSGPGEARRSDFDPLALTLDQAIASLGVISGTSRLGVAA